MLTSSEIENQVSGVPVLDVLSVKNKDHGFCGGQGVTTIHHFNNRR